MKITSTHHALKEAQHQAIRARSRGGVAPRGAVAAKKYGMEFVDVRDLQIDRDLLMEFDSEVLFQRGVLPYFRDGNRVFIAISDPADIDTHAELHLIYGQSFVTRLGDRESIVRILKEQLGVGSGSLAKMSAEDEAMTQRASDSTVIANGNEAKEDQLFIASLVDDLLEDACTQGASDIHLEAEEVSFVVRYRVDGLLREVNFPDAIQHFRQALVSRIKVLSGLNIAERRLPQDGRFKSRLRHGEVDVRVSIIPMMYGECVVLRLLNRERGVISLESLPIPEPEATQFKNMIRQPSGIILITGPTGSGKTTTLYSVLNSLRSSEIKIVTIEDPVEYTLPGVHQIQVHEKIGRTFANGLRSILRHDPDVVLVGEIRDVETAKHAMQASLTGHLVLSTLHTNDACSAVARLADMGVEPYLVATTLRSVMAQRLARKLCDKCKVETDIRQHTLPYDFPSDSMSVFEAVGCRECLGTGFKGQIPLFEFLPLTDSIRRVAAQGGEASKIHSTARAEGMRSLRECGWLAVANGNTTIDEVLRVTGILETNLS